MLVSKSLTQKILHFIQAVHHSRKVHTYYLPTCAARSHKQPLATYHTHHSQFTHDFISEVSTVVLIVALIVPLIVALIVACDPQTAHDGSRQLAWLIDARRSRDNPETGPWLA